MGGWLLGYFLPVIVVNEVIQKVTKSDGGGGKPNRNPYKYKLSAQHSKGATKSDGGLAYLVSQKWHHLWTAPKVQRTGGHLAGIENQPGLKISEKNISSFCPFLVQKCMILFREKKSCIQKKEKDSQPVWRCIIWHEFNNSGWFIKDYMVINYQIKLFFSSRLPINIISTG